MIKVMFLHKRFDLRLLVFLLGACFACSIGLSFVSFLDTASDRICCFCISFLIFIENVTRTPPLLCLPDTVPHQSDSFLNLHAKIQEMDSVVSIRLHPTSNIDIRFFTKQSFSFPMVPSEPLESRSLLFIVGNTENLIKRRREINLYRPPTLSRIVPTCPRVVKLNFPMRSYQRDTHIRVSMFSPWSMTSILSSPFFGPCSFRIRRIADMSTGVACANTNFVLPVLIKNRH